MLNSDERGILEKLVFAAEQDPSMPTFPVTRAYPLSVPHFTNVILKDESTNPTGTHKDRMAWEIVMVYLDILRAKESGLYDKPLPHMSIISAGSAALAIQSQFRKFGLPNLKILVDESTDQSVVRYLRNIGCEVFQRKLGESPLSPEQILAETDNADGFDVTSNKGFDPNVRFYDWLGYEILNENADHVFMPFGTGQLYENVLNIARLVSSGAADHVFVGDPDAVRRCNFFGATTNDPDTKAVKLYAPFRPFTSVSNQLVKLLAMRGLCGKDSSILEVSEENIEYAKSLLDNARVPAEYSAAAGLGLLYQLKDAIPRDARILVVSTGKTKMGE